MAFDLENGAQGLPERLAMASRQGMQGRGSESGASSGGTPAATAPRPGVIAPVSQKETRKTLSSVPSQSGPHDFSDAIPTEGFTGEFDVKDHALDTILGRHGHGRALRDAVQTDTSACICPRKQHLAELTTRIHGGQCLISRYSPRPTRMNSSLYLPGLPSQCLAKKVLGVEDAQGTHAAMTSFALNGSRILRSRTARRISRMRYPSRFMTVSRSVVACRSRTLVLWTASGSPALLQRDRWFTLP